MLAAVFAGILVTKIRDEYWPTRELMIPTYLAPIAGLAVWLQTGVSLCFVAGICFALGVLAADDLDDEIDLDVDEHEGPKESRWSSLLRKLPRPTRRPPAPYKPEDDPNWTNYKP